VAVFENPPEPFGVDDDPFPVELQLAQNATTHSARDA
jgi:hypothetical protein